MSHFQEILIFDNLFSYLSTKQRLQSFHGQHEFERNYIDSQSTTLETLNKCFAVTPIEATFLEDDSVVRLLVNELLPVCFCLNIFF